MPGCHRVLVYARTHTQTTWVLDVSPGVGWTPEEPEEYRSNKAQYTCKPYSCTKLHLSIYMLGCWFWWSRLTALLYFKMFFLLRKVDVTTISNPQSLNSLRIKNCTLTDPNTTTSLFLYEQQYKQSSLQYSYSSCTQPNSCTQSWSDILDWNGFITNESPPLPWQTHQDLTLWRHSTLYVEFGDHPWSSFWFSNKQHYLSLVESLWLWVHYNIGCRSVLK